MAACKMYLLEHCLPDGCQIQFRMGRGSLSLLVTPRMCSVLEIFLPSLPLIPSLQNAPGFFFLPEFWFLVNKLYEIFISFKKCFLSFPCQLNSWGHPFSQGKVLISASSVSFWVGKLGCGISLTCIFHAWCIFQMIFPTPSWKKSLFIWVSCLLPVSTSTHPSGLLELEPVLALKSWLNTYLSTICIQWYHVCSLTLAMVRVVTPWRLADAMNQSQLLHTSAHHWAPLCGYLSSSLFIRWKLGSCFTTFFFPPCVTTLSEITVSVLN